MTGSPGHISCVGAPDGSEAGPCTDSFAGGTTITLSESTFQGSPADVTWGNCDSVSADGTTCTVTMNGVKNVIVFFH